MSNPGTTRRAALAAAAVSIIIASVPAASNAQPRDEWQFRAAVYGYFPDIGGSTSFPAGDGRTIDVGADQLLRHLKFAFMGSLEAQKGRWGAFTDLIYLDVGGSKSGTRELSIAGMPLPPGITADGSLDIKGWVWTLAGSYRAVSAPDATVDLFGGARLLDMTTKLDYAFNADFGPFAGPAREGSSEVSRANWDAIAGVKGRVTLGDRGTWFVPYYADVGAGASKLTWQAMAGLGYAFEWGEIVAAWRYLDYEFKSGAKLDTLDFSGPAVGIAFRW